MGISRVIITLITIKRNQAGDTHKHREQDQAVLLQKDIAAEDRDQEILSLIIIDPAALVLTAIMEAEGTVLHMEIRQEEVQAGEVQVEVAAIAAAVTAAGGKR